MWSVCVFPDVVSLCFSRSFLPVLPLPFLWELLGSGEFSKQSRCGNWVCSWFLVISFHCWLVLKCDLSDWDCFPWPPVLSFLCSLSVSSEHFGLSTSLQLSWLLKILSSSCYSMLACTRHRLRSGPICALCSDNGFLTHRAMLAASSL